MEQYIPKSALVAKIKKEIKDIYAGREYVGIPSWEERKIDGLEKAIKILNTLEVKEVWKPNAEQMKVLWYLDNGIPLNNFDKRVLHVLIDELKKLREE